MAPLMMHHDWLGRSSLDQTALNLFEPGEEMVGSFDGVTSHPHLRHVAINIASQAVILGLIGLYVSLESRTTARNAIWLAASAIEALLFLLVLVILRLTNSRRMMFALTTQGLVSCGVDRLNRPRSVICRTPTPAPLVLHRGRSWREARFGDIDIWVHRSMDPVIARMAQAASGVDVPQQRQMPGPGGPPVVPERPLDVVAPSGDVSWPGFAPPSIRSGRDVPEAGDAPYPGWERPHT